MRITRTVLAAALCGASFTAVSTVPSLSGTAGAAGEAVQPLRVLDTRSGFGASSGRLDPGETITLPMSQAAGASAVSLNLTATEASGAGYITAWPCGESPPATSILNFVPGQTAANFVAIGVGAGGVCLAASAPVHVAADLMGEFTGTSDFRGATPTRLLDTRQGGNRLGAGEERRLSISGNAGAVAVNLTVVNPAADGFVVAYPCGPRPLASTVNFRAGEVVPNFTLVPVSGGEICLFSSAATDLVVDRFGSSSNADELRLTSPARLLDTRNNTGTTSGAASPSNTVTLRVAGRGSVPNDASAALMTITAAGGRADGYVTTWPCDQPRPNASVLNLRPNLLGSNLALVKLAADGTACLYAYTVDGSSVHLIVDGVGALPGGPDRPAPPPDPPPTPPDPPAPPGGGGSGYFTTLPPGSPLPSDAECAAMVRTAPEIRPQNAGYNATTGHQKNMGDPWFDRVTGNYTGTTDQIIQWAACKWGFDEDIVRAQTATESWWHQGAVNDVGDTFGLLQLRSPYWDWALPDGISSSAYNMDAALSARRKCFDGAETWLGGSYGPGDLWGCIGLWFSGRWHDPPAESYIADVQHNLSIRLWERPEFINHTL